MDLATVVGMIGSFGIVLAAMILGGGLGVFVNIPSLLIVAGGSAFVVLAKFNVSQFLGATKIAMKAFFFKSQSIDELIEMCVKLATAARKGGLLSLENFKVENVMLQKGIQLLVDGHDADVVRGMLSKDLQQTLDRHESGQKIFSAMADVAPAMGMIGTLVGLVQMLSAMDDPKSIGPAMAVALLTTLYGAMIANMLCGPIVTKLELRSYEEKITRLLIMDALSAIQAGQNPRVILEFLKSYLPASARKDDADASENPE